MDKVELDFLIVGAAKSGTTALYRMLEEHPQIFLPENKEPKFISSQFTRYPLAGPGDSGVEKLSCSTMEELAVLYDSKRDNQIAGEGSVDNLYYYHKSIPLIKRYFGDPKILILLRNPVDRAYSAYCHLVRDGRETLEFSQALSREESRRKNNWQFLWSYFSVGLYYQQVKSFVESFSAVKIIIYDEFSVKPEETIKGVYEYLGVDREYLVNTKSRHNISGVPKNRIYESLLYPKSLALKTVKYRIRSLLGERMTRKLRSKFKGAMLRKPPIDADVKKELMSRYKEDIEQLSVLINKDLSGWYR